MRGFAATGRAGYGLAGVMGALVVAGCGGGGGSTGAVSSTGSTGSSGGGGTSQTTQVGEMTIGYSGVAKPAVQTAGSVSVTTMAGATLTTVAMVPNKTLSNTVMAAVGSSHELLVYQNGVVNSISTTATTLMAYGVGFTQDGRLGFMGFDETHQTTGLYACNYDGSNMVLLADTGASSAPAFSPDGSKVAFTTGSYLCVANSNGTGEKAIESIYPAATSVSWSPDSSHILYTADTGGPFTLNSVPYAGGTPTVLYQTSSSILLDPSYAIGGQYIGLSVEDAIDIFDVDGPTGLSTNPASGYRDDHVAFAPDGKTLAFVRSSSGSASILQSNVNLTSFQYLPFQDSSYLSLAWSPYFTNRSFIGPAGSIGSSAVGFVWSQLSDGFAGLCTYTASSPTGATITEVGQANESGDLVYDLHATAITGVQWINGYFNPPLRGALTGTDALVTIGAASGQIETVVALAIGTDPKKVVAKTASGITYNGKITAFYTRDGVNHAANGASQVAYQSKSKTVQMLR